jgi:nicotinamide mononucleotide (NMN) deamidase PncC
LSGLGDFHYHLAVTGTAGPSGGSREKPVGTVFVGYRDESVTRIKKHLFVGTRREIKEATLLEVLQQLWAGLTGTS